ncbi:MAG: HlyD family efflux transporter periplasmic adaptor subunit [Rubrivivax sp.]|nr:HlyD family efflux transporter periplasmic adaptor subunit [Rubrivivax sp.]
MRSLFRPEAVEAQRQHWLGRVQLVQPLSLTLLTAGALIVAAVVVAFLLLGQYTRKATAEGVLVPDRGLIRLVPAAAGTVVERHATEGQAVRAGDVLFVLALERSLLAPQAEAEVQRSLQERRRSLQQAAAQEQALVRARQAALDRRLQALELELAQAEGESALQRQRLALAEESLARLRSLESAQFISSAQVQAKSEEVLGLRAAAQALARQRAALARERAELEGERSSLPLAAGTTLAGIERELALLARESAETDAERRLVIRAPQSGTVTAVLAEPGQSVTPASALASLVPEGATLQAHLFAPSSAVGFVRPEQPVRLRFEAFPYQKFGHRPGRVVQVSRTPLAASELAALALPAVAATGEPMFRITVALEDAATTPAAEAMALGAGMRLQADVLLDRRRLIEWLFEPLLGLKGRV